MHHQNTFIINNLHRFRHFSLFAYHSPHPDHRPHFFFFIFPFSFSILCPPLPIYIVHDLFSTTHFPPPHQQIFFATSKKLRTFAPDFNRKSRSVMPRSCDRNLRNFYVGKTALMVRVLCVGCYSYIFQQRYFSGPLSKTWYTVPRFIVYLFVAARTSTI